MAIFSQLHVVYAQWTNVWSLNYRCGYIELFGGYWTVVWLLTKRKKLSFVNIVHTNTFFYSNEKLSQSYANMDSNGATFKYPKCYYSWGGLQFFGHALLEGGRIFGLLACEVLKVLGPRFLNNTGPPPPPPIVNDRSLNLKRKVTIREERKQEKWSSFSFQYLPCESLTLSSLM